MRRRTEGAETWNRLQQWARGSAASERLVAHILRAEGFEAVDPSHPLGGPDKLRDVVCEYGGRRFRAAVYFPRGQKPFSTILNKFRKDLGNLDKPDNEGFAFITNQELRLGERKKLAAVASKKEVNILHLERIASILDSPSMYGVRLEFLDIEMTREEQVAFFSAMHRSNADLAATFRSFVQQISQSGILDQKLASGVPLAEMREFSALVNALSGRATPGFVTFEPSVRDLHVPLAEMREFSALVNALGGRATPGFVTFEPSVRDLHVPLAEMREFSALVNALSGRATPGFATFEPSVRDLHVPLAEMREFYEILTDAIEKAKQLRECATPLLGFSAAEKKR